MFLEVTYDATLDQATVILQYFLGLSVPISISIPVLIQYFKQLPAASILDLPPELASIDEPEEIATNYLHYHQFFLIWNTIA